MTVTFHSTRSTSPVCNAQQAIRQGIAQDGGLLVSDQLGSQHYDYSRLLTSSYQQLAQDILSLLLPDFTAEALNTCVERAYGSQWDTSIITPLHKLNNDNTYVLELFHGPTCAFKDIALQILPQFMASSTNTQTDSNSASSEQDRILILTATSGDTGKAALSGFADVDNMGILTFYPEGKVSRIQELQMTTQQGRNVRACAVRGNFDDAQTGVKRIFNDMQLSHDVSQKNHVTLSSANSINIGRLAPQVVYYFSAYAQLVRQGAIRLGDEVEFCVPTGNFGDILAGYYAKMLGLPVKHLIVASNSNHVLFDFLRTGTYNRDRPFYQTIAPSMDILISSNLERMLYYMSDHDTRLIQMIMNDLQQWNAFEIPESLLSTIRQLFACGWASEEQIIYSIRECWDKYQYLIDPHSACGYFVMQHIPHDTTVPRVLLSTASPYKFPRVVAQALDLVHDNYDEFDYMDLLEERTGLLKPPMLAELKHVNPRFHDVIKVQDMPSYVRACAQELF